ncbi:MAG: phosphate--acyl-ACP acyltransferase, partial [Thermoplasmata archaeon M9B2D]
MIIALDAMGGDFAPEVNIDGAIDSFQDNDDIRVVLVGDEERIAKGLKEKNAPTDRISVCHAPDVVSMDESPSYALRKRKESSIAIAVDLVRDGKADAVVSAGHSGVAMAMCLIKLGKAKGVNRPAIATIMPSLKDPFVLLDAGANVDCEPNNLLEFAMMGSAYSSALFNKKEPKVALMNIGEEETKGNELTKETFKLLRKSHVNFVGNIEGKDMFRGRADVVVCDGFAGNITLKISEGLSEAIFRMLKREVGRSVLGRIGYLFMRPALKSFKRQTDYAEYGGAPLLGINGTCIISHGRSSAKAIKNAISVANTVSMKRVYET